MSIIPAAASERILKKAGARRVSDEAKKAFSEVLEQLGDEISKKAVGIAKNCDRKTVSAADIKMVKV